MLNTVIYINIQLIGFIYFAKCFKSVKHVLTFDGLKEVSGTRKPAKPD